VVLWVVAVAAQVGASSLDSLPAWRDYQMRRITSHDPTAGNKDWRSLAPHATLVLADIQGPGCIVHFRDNITCREPAVLPRKLLIAKITPCRRVHVAWNRAARKERADELEEDEPCGSVGDGRDRSRVLPLLSRAPGRSARLAGRARGGAVRLRAPQLDLRGRLRLS